MTGEKVGLIGVGLLGRAIAQRLVGAGHAVTGFDLDPEKRAQLAALGATAVASVAEVARACQQLVLAVFNTDQVAEVIEGPDGLLSVPRAGGYLVVCCSTCDPDQLALLAARVAARGSALIEAPLSGTSSQVAKGEGVGLVAGDPAAAARVGAVLDAICPKRYLLGAPGNGARAKLAINLILGLNRAAIAEGIAFAERLGLDRARFLEVAKGSAAYSQVMDVKGHLWASNAFEQALSRVDQSLKDFKLMVEQGRKVGLGLPLASLYVDLLEGCVAQGESALDNAVIINEIRRRGTA